MLVSSEPILSVLGRCNSEERLVAWRNRSKMKKEKQTKTKPRPNRANNPQIDHWEQNEDAPLRNSLYKRSSLKMFNSILPHFIHFPTSLTFQGPTRGVPFFLFFFFFSGRVCWNNQLGKREGKDNTQESCETGGLERAAAQSR